MAMCEMIPEEAFTYETGMGRTEDAEAYLDSLSKKFPGHNWRVILDRSGHYTRWVLTVDDKDPREHYVPKSMDPEYPETCIHCGKTAKELGVEERDDDD